MKKRIFAVILAALMVAAIFPLTAFASVSGNSHATEVKIGSVTLNATDKYYLDNGTVSENKPSGGYAHFDASAGELTLYNLVLNANAIQSGSGAIKATGNIKIIVPENTASTITVNRGENDYGGGAIYVYSGKLEITGKGTLNINSSSDYTILSEKALPYEGASQPDDAELARDTSVVIDSCTLNLTTEDRTQAISTYYNDVIVKDGAKVNITKSDRNKAVSIINGKFKIDGGDVKIVSTGVAYVYLVDASKLEVNKGSLQIKGDETSNDGIYAHSGFTMNGGYLLIEGVTEAFEQGNIVIGNGFKALWRTDKNDEFSSEALPSVTDKTYIEVIGEPNITYPNGSSFEQGKAPEGFGVDIDLDFPDFSLENFGGEVEISKDGKTYTELNPETDYEVLSGSILMKLEKDYLNTLSAGNYKIRVSLVDAALDSVNAEFTVTEAKAASTGIVHDIVSAITTPSEENPNTGAEAAVSVVAALAVISGAVLVLKKRK